MRNFEWITSPFLNVFAESVFCVAFDPTGAFLVSGGQDHVAIVRNVDSKQTVFTTEGTFLPGGITLSPYWLLTMICFTNDGFFILCICLH